MKLARNPAMTSAALKLFRYGMEQAARLPLYIVLLSIAALCGCSGIALSYGTESAYNAAFRTGTEDLGALGPDARAKLAQVTILDSSIPEGVVRKGEVSGLACKLTVAVLVFKWTWKPELNDVNGQTPEDAARTQMKAKAVKLEANLIYDSRCVRSEGLDWSNNCFESVVCTGKAGATE